MTTTGPGQGEAGGRAWPAPLLLVLVWLVGAVVATAVGVLAVRLVATQVGDPAVPPLSAAAANPLPTAQPLAPPAPGARTPEPPPPAPAGNARAFPSAGGTVGVSCSGAVARLVFATPAAGYTLDEQTVAGGDVEVRFESDSNRVRLELAGADGTPVLVGERVDPAGGGTDDDGQVSDLTGQPRATRRTSSRAAGSTSTRSPCA